MRHFENDLEKVKPTSFDFMYFFLMNVSPQALLSASNLKSV